MFALSLEAAPVRSVHSTVELVAEAPQADGSFLAGAYFRLDPGWHVYWQNPGDSGEPPTLSWDLPEGWTAGPILWPAPKRIPVGPLVNFGYEGDVLFAVKLSPPAGRSAPKRLEAKTGFLICKEECLPAEAELGIDLPAAPRPELFAVNEKRLPKPLASRASAAPTKRGYVLEAAGLSAPAWFFPQEEQVLANAAEQDSSFKNGALRLELTAAPQAALRAGRLRGVLSAGADAWSVDIPVRASGFGEPARAALFAFLGGLLLNLMPCVFPVLSLKILSFVKDPAGAAKSGAAYSAGVVASFWVLAGLLFALRSAGHALGWGFQLQSPIVVGLLAALFLAMAFNFLGFFEIGVSLTRLGGGNRGAFATGALAVVAATPCTAPFMGAALGYALLLPPAGAFAVFTALGLGMAAPYAALAARPSWLAFLPKPGPWLDTFKKAMSVPMLMTAAWLLWVLARQLAPASAASGPVRWTPWSAKAVAEARAAGRPVLVNFTAAWCITCQVNDKAALGTQAGADLYARTGTAVFKADWTSRDAGITRALEALGRSGVPVYAYYARGASQAALLPSLLTPAILESALTPKEARP